MLKANKVLLRPVLVGTLVVSHDNFFFYLEVEVIYTALSENYFPISDRVSMKNSMRSIVILTFPFGGLG